MSDPTFLPEGAVAVIFTSQRNHDDPDGYATMAECMMTLVEEQDGYLGATSVRDPASGLGITVSYWRDEEAARQWKQVAEHRVAQHEGRQRWYAYYRVEVCKVIRQYGASSSSMHD